MSVKAPVRRVESLYLQLGGKNTITSIVERFYEKMLADGDLRRLFAKANMPQVKRRQAQYLAQELGGPNSGNGQQVEPGHDGVLREARHLERAATHLAVALSEMGIAPDLVDAVMERAAGDHQLADADSDFESDEARQKEDWLGQLAAISKSQAVIEFQLDGTIVTANENFLRTMGYTLEEIKGHHHSMFADEGTRYSPEYKDFWAKLNRGEYQAGEYRRLAKGGKEVWIQASYNPILDAHGKPFKVVKYATDITGQKQANANYAGQLAAISKSQAVIEFQLDGTILTANENFLRVMGYSLDEVKGKHHSMFADEATRNSPEYREFWAKLNRGEYQAADYKRLGRGGKEVWIQASYNPILDANGKPFKVVKYATDITAQKQANANYAGTTRRHRQIASGHRVSDGRHHSHRQ